MAADAPPRFVDQLLGWRPTWFTARLLLVSAYLLGGVTKLADWPGAVAEQAHLGYIPLVYGPLLPFLSRSSVRC
jgi:uncharacterized membrane protein YphA (DoxX/SURF4 family)